MLYTSLFTLFAAAVLTTSALPKTKCGSASFGNVFQERVCPVCTEKLLRIVGSFQHSDWQGLPQTATSGPDNKKGSTRTVALSSTINLIEEIESYKVNKKADTTTTVFFLHNGPGTVGDNTITYYRETFVTRPLCHGRASQIEWGVDFCYTQGTNASVGALFVGAHTGGLNNVTALLGVQSFDGDCRKL
ncbi:BQ5605_C007g04803 [Microbotryum silenes-dioicae]|uniref:BQ5605_C007g04803 protein n=1 Tax=Microbotryum silenes-dioicae TaxID=796604 RepID=A0A2X0PA35_9BASI|nr:BQ5605_C007g04803 [Microbotryum silenes-dioicae]